MSTQAHELFLCRARLAELAPEIEALRKELKAKEDEFHEELKEKWRLQAELIEVKVIPLGVSSRVKRISPSIDYEAIADLTEEQLQELARELAEAGGKYG